MFTTYEPVGPDRVTNKTNGTQDEAEHGEVRHAVTDEHWLKNYSPKSRVPKLGEAGNGIVVRRLPEGARGRPSDPTLIDPMSFFCLSGQRSVPAELAMLLRCLQDGTEVPFSLRKDDSNGHSRYLLTREFRFNANDHQERPRVVESVFDSAFGFNPVLSVATNANGHVESKREWSYREMSGTWIPSRVHIKTFSDHTHTLIADRVFTLLQAKINEPIDDVVFSRENLGMIEGDKIQDKIQGTTLRLHNGKLIPPEKYPRSEVAAQPNAGISSVALFAVNIIGLSVAIYLRRNRKK